MEILWSITFAIDQQRKGRDFIYWYPRYTGLAFYEEKFQNKVAIRGQSFDRPTFCFLCFLYFVVPSTSKENVLSIMSVFLVSLYHLGDVRLSFVEKN